MLMTEPVTPSIAPASASLGARLRAGREARQLSVADMAARLRVSLAIVEAMERDDLDRLGATVYARGYLASYARVVELPLVVVDRVLQQHTSPLPVLHSTTHVSHGRFLIDRYARRAASIVLTASIVVPVVWLATEERLPVQPLALRSLDAPVTDSAPGVAKHDGTSGELSPVGPPEFLAGGVEELTPAAIDSPVMASFTPFLNSRPAAAAEALGSAAGWLLQFRGDSWVEIVDHDGRRLEFGVIRAGSERRYPAGSIARVALGNAGVVTVVRDGEPMPLTPFQRANVARFAVSSTGELSPAGG
jgi:cytoskeleton protein RodZ